MGDRTRTRPKPDPHKDKLAYFKDNFQTQEEEEFDPKIYYYHRSEKDQPPHGAPVPGMPPQQPPHNPALISNTPPLTDHMVASRYMYSAPGPGVNLRASGGQTPQRPSSTPIGPASQPMYATAAMPVQAHPQIPVVAVGRQQPAMSPAMPNMPTAAQRELMNQRFGNPGLPMHGGNRPLSNSAGNARTGMPAARMAMAAGGRGTHVASPMGPMPGTRQVSPLIVQGGMTIPAGYNPNEMMGVMNRPASAGAGAPGYPTAATKLPPGIEAKVMAPTQPLDPLVIQNQAPSREALSLHDMSEFPRLGKNEEGLSKSVGPGHKEFSMQNEEFPALGGYKDIGKDQSLEGIAPYQLPMTGAFAGKAPASRTAPYVALNSSGERIGAETGGSPYAGYAQFSDPHLSQQPSQRQATGPAKESAVMTDRYGLLGLLNVIKMTDPDLNTLALGTDLTTLGLNLNSPECLYATFSSPFTDGPSRREPEFNLPLCYYMQPPMQPPQLKVGLFSDETLLYVFYSMPKDRLQMVAANELYNREWRYHTDLQMWFQRPAGVEVLKANTYERGTLIFFDPNTWERVKKDNFVLHYEHIADHPQMT